VRYLIGIVIGVLLCAVYPNLPRTAQLKINEAAHMLSQATEPTVIDSVDEALTNWRRQ